MAKKCYQSKSCRFISMLIMTAGFFLVEIIVGYLVNSIALIADSFHMLSDVVALVVGFASIRISKMQSKHNTFGWQRAEVLGAMVNAVFLCALCFTILVESVQRLITIEEVENPKLMLIVGAAGLAVNLIGLFLFGHGHSHGGGGSHGHSHGGGSHSHGDSAHGHSHNNVREGELCPNDTGAEREKLTAADDSSTKTDENGDLAMEMSEDEDMNAQLSCVTIMDSDKYEAAVATEQENKKNKKKSSSSSQLNMRGVFLHVLGDALGSVVVVISALIIWFVEDDWKYYVDPAMSMIMVIIILSTTVPLLKESSFILLQSVPQHINTVDVKSKIKSLHGVIDLHEFHVWQLAGNRVIASTHIKIDSTSLLDYVRISEDIKKVFHEEGIHSVTVQPEFIAISGDVGDSRSADAKHHSKTGRDCALECGPDQDCYRNTCCGPVGSLSQPKDEEAVRLTTYSLPTANRPPTVMENANGTAGVV